MYDLKDRGSIHARAPTRWGVNLKKPVAQEHKKRGSPDDEGEEKSPVATCRERFNYFA